MLESVHVLFKDEHLMRNLAGWWPTVAVLTSLFMGPQPSNPPTRTRIDVSKFGPQVGERVPDFNLQDQNGKTWTLRSIMGPKGAMLVFFRSADW
jgi:hypothetical protein